MKRKICFPLCVLLFLSVLFTSSSFNVSAQPEYGYGLQAAFPQLTFNQPVGLYHAGDGSSRLFVIEQAGVIRVFANFENVAAAQVFLDISDRVFSGGEQGLLGLAFHPNFSVNGYFYVNYVADNPRRTVIARYFVVPRSITQADRNSEFVLLEIPQPFPNHNGGELAFGADGYLYIGVGDGGSGGDPFGNGQSLSTLLGKILRIDVNSFSGGQNYAIPMDNPFVGNTQDYREEIYAYGFRNPWRFSFDPVTGWLWVDDVGQSQIEEIDIVERGKNYGWNIMEGSLCYDPAIGCNQTGLELPVYEYNHSRGVAVVGGFVYRGSDVAGLYGSYVYGDYGSGRIWALSYNDSGSATNTLLVNSNLIISSFGVDDTNELYVCAFDGKIYKITASVIPEFSAWAIAVVMAGVTLLVIIVIAKRRSRLLS